MTWIQIKFSNFDIYVNEDGVQKTGIIRNNKGRLMQEHELEKGNKNGKKILIREIKYGWD